MHTTLRCCKETLLRSSDAIPLVVYGLGNYTFPATKHSLGQVLTDSLAKKARASNYAFDAKMHAWIASATLPANNNQRVLFVKSKKFMNLSGDTARALAHRWPELLAHHKLLVLHDDLELPAAKYRARLGGSAKGHNGLRDIIKKLEPEAKRYSKDFHRFSIGIGRPEDCPGREKLSVADWCLSASSRDELEACSLDGDTTLAAWEYLHTLGQQKPVV